MGSTSDKSSVSIGILSKTLKKVEANRTVNTRPSLRVDSTIAFPAKIPRALLFFLSKDHLIFDFNKTIMSHTRILLDNHQCVRRKDLVNNIHFLQGKKRRHNLQVF